MADTPDDLSRFCCVNADCADLGKRGAGNLTVPATYGGGRRVLRCRTCKSRFSERKGTVFFNSRLGDDQVVELLDHVREGCGVRKTSPLTGVHRDTVTRYSVLAGVHAAGLHDEKVAFSPRDGGGPVRRKMGLRRKEAGPLRSGRPRR